jgi:hypothetical protein
MDKLYYCEKCNTNFKYQCYLNYHQERCNLIQETFKNICKFYELDNEIKLKKLQYCGLITKSFLKNFESDNFDKNLILKNLQKIHKNTLIALCYNLKNLF